MWICPKASQVGSFGELWTVTWCESSFCRESCWGKSSKSIFRCSDHPGWCLQFAGASQSLPSTRPCLPSLSLCPSDPGLCSFFFFLPLLPMWTFDQTIILASCSLILSGFFLVVFQILGLWLWLSIEVQRKQIRHVEMWRPTSTLGGGWFSSCSMWLGVGEPYMRFQVGQSLEYNAVFRRTHLFHI